MNTFETSLLEELREHVATRPVHPPVTARRGPVVRWGLTAAAAVAATVAVVTLTAPASAYAVTREPDGHVTVTISRLDDAAGLQKALRDDGIHAVVDYSGAALPSAPAGSSLHRTTGTGGDGQTLSPSDGATSPAAGGCSVPGPLQVSTGHDSVTFDIPAPAVGVDATLFITTSGSAASGASGVQVRWQC